MTSAEVVIICSDIIYIYVTHDTQLCLSTHPWSVLTIGQGWRNIHLYTQEHEVQENQQPAADSMAKLNSYAWKKSCLEDDPFHQRDGHQASKKWKSESPSSTQPSVNSGSSSLFLWRCSCNWFSGWRVPSTAVLGITSWSQHWVNEGDLCQNDTWIFQRCRISAFWSVFFGWISAQLLQTWKIQVCLVEAFRKETRVETETFWNYCKDKNELIRNTTNKNDKNSSNNDYSND